MRMFAPAFLFGVISRFFPEWGLAENCPHFLTSNFGLFVFGVLGVLEVVANWDDSVRELISESNIEAYVKPLVAALMSYSICTPEQTQVLAAAVGGVSDALSAASGSVVVELASNAVTSAASAVSSGMDVHAVSNAVGVVAPGPVEAASSAGGLSFSAIVASLFCCGGTFGLCKVRAGIVAAVRELDPDNALNLNTLLTMIEEGSWLAILPVLMVFPFLALLLMVLAAVLGWLLSRPLKKIAESRRAYWDAVGKEGMLKTVRNRAVVIFVVGVFLSAIPVLGYLSTVIALNLLVFGVLSMYEKPSSRIIAKLVMRFVKLTLLLIALFFSSIPFLGIILLLPHVVSYLMRVHNIKCRGCSQSGRILEGN